MASLKDVARDLLNEARDAIAELVIWKEGRSWQGKAFYDVDYDGESYFISDDCIDELKEIAEKDPNAIAVNGYYDNIGAIYDEMTVQTLMHGIKFQYETAPGTLNKVLEQANIDNNDKTTFFCVTTIVYNNGRVLAAITNACKAAKKPKNHFTSTDRRDIYSDWFDNLEDAEEYVKEAKAA